MRAYVLIKINPQDTASILRHLKDNERIIEASLIHGPYDCLAVVQTKDLDAVNDTVLAIRAMNGVTDTLTCLIIQSWQRTG